LYSSSFFFVDGIGWCGSDNQCNPNRRSQQTNKQTTNQGMEKITEQIADLRRTTTSLKQQKRERTAKIYAQFQRMERATAELAKAAAAEQVEQRALKEAIAVRDVTQELLFARVLRCILSGEDNRPMLWFDMAYHSEWYNSINVEREDLDKNDLTFDDGDIQRHWNAVKHLFEVTLETRRVHVRSLGDDEDGIPTGWCFKYMGENHVSITSLVRDVCHSFASDVFDSAESIDSEVNRDDGNDNFELSGEKEGVITYHFIKATLKSDAQHLDAVASPMDVQSQ
jgi:hypothetical protein